MKPESETSDLFFQAILVAFVLAVASLLVGALLALLVTFIFYDYLESTKPRLVIGLALAATSLGLYFYYPFSKEIVRTIVSLNTGASGLIFIVAFPLIRQKKVRHALKIGITIKAFKNRTRKPRGKNLLGDPSKVAIGVSKISGEVVYLEESRRKMHTLVLGATGMGKSTLLKSMLIHAAKYKQPCVVIDPKPDSNDIIDLYRLVEEIHGDTSKIRLFDFTDPKSSQKYNPIANGSPLEIKDRIMASLNWSEQYFESVAADFLMAVLPAIIYLGLKPSFKVLCEIIRNDGFKSKIIADLKARSLVDTKAIKLLADLVGLERYDNKQLSGLAAQLSIFENQEFGDLFNVGSNDSNYIDLSDSYLNNEIVYFKLNTLGNGHTAKRLGALVLEDLKALCNRIYRGDFKGERKFFPIFVDEFGAFATLNFLDFLKQCRGAGFGLHLFSQGLEDLDAVDKHFRRQVLSNPLTKIILRMDDSDGVDQVVNSIGTKDQIEQSYQVSGGFFGVTRTGMGNERETKGVLVSHDVFKQLGVGQAVFFEKSPARQDLIELLRPKDVLSSYKVANLSI